MFCGVCWLLWLLWEVSGRRPVMGSSGQRDCGKAQAMVREAKGRCERPGQRLRCWGMLLDHLHMLWFKR